MKTQDFCYWLQGLFELSDPKTLSKKQTDLIKRHLALVFMHDIDPSQGSEEHQAKLNKIHNPPKIGGIDKDTGEIYRC
jgi:hypothetical protein